MHRELRVLDVVSQQLGDEGEIGSEGDGRVTNATSTEHEALQLSALGPQQAHGPLRGQLMSVPLIVLWPYLVARWAPDQVVAHVASLASPG